jgi:hypothetical protein
MLESSEIAEALLISFFGWHALKSKECYRIPGVVNADEQQQNRCRSPNVQCQRRIVEEQFANHFQSRVGTYQKVFDIQAFALQSEYSHHRYERVTKQTACISIRN